MCRTDAADRRSASPLNSQEMTVSWGKLGRSFLFALNEQTNNADDDHAELIQLCEAYVHSTTPSCERESPLFYREVRPPTVMAASVSSVNIIRRKIQGRINSLSVLFRRAHQANDKAVMQTYGFWGKLNTETACVAELMKMYLELTEKK